LLVILATTASAEQTKREPAASPFDRSGVAAFNKAFTSAVRAMNDEAVLSLWADDGVALLPDTPPVRGKSQMATMLRGISSAHPKARMESFTNDCFDIEGEGPFVSEWCLEHQIVSEPGKPTFDSWGKMLLVLHEQAPGEWRLVREMWNHANSSDHPAE
jgi:ketosteroid isomerase-like protein